MEWWSPLPLGQRVVQMLVALTVCFQYWICRHQRSVNEGHSSSQNSCRLECCRWHQVEWNDDWNEQMINKQINNIIRRVTGPNKNNVFTAVFNYLQAQAISTSFLQDRLWNTFLAAASKKTYFTTRRTLECLSLKKDENRNK